MNYYEHHIGDIRAGQKLKSLPVVYAVATHDLKFVKIGKSKSFPGRLSNIQTGCPFDLFVWLQIRTPRFSEIERFVHDHLKNSHLRGEWFSPSTSQLDWLVSFFSKTNQEVRRVSGLSVVGDLIK